MKAETKTWQCTECDTESCTVTQTDRMPFAGFSDPHHCPFGGGYANWKECPKL